MDESNAVPGAVPEEPQPRPRAHQYRKMKIERQRRARVDQCLRELKELVVKPLAPADEDLSTFGDAEILGVTLRYVQLVQQVQDVHQQVQSIRKASSKFDERFIRVGYKLCVNELCSYLNNDPGISIQLRTKISAHMAERFATLDIKLDCPQSSQAATPGSSSMANLQLSSQIPNFNCPTIASAAPIYSPVSSPGSPGSPGPQASSAEKSQPLLVLSGQNNNSTAPSVVSDPRTNTESPLDLSSKRNSSANLSIISGQCSDSVASHVPTNQRFQPAEPLQFFGQCSYSPARPVLTNQFSSLLTTHQPNLTAPTVPLDQLMNSAPSAASFDHQQIDSVVSNSRKPPITSSQRSISASHQNHPSQPRNTVIRAPNSGRLRNPSPYGRPQSLRPQTSVPLAICGQCVNSAVNTASHGVCNISAVPQYNTGENSCSVLTVRHTGLGRNLPIPTASLGQSSNPAAPQNNPGRQRNSVIRVSNNVHGRNSATPTASLGQCSNPVATQYTTGQIRNSALTVGNSAQGRNLAIPTANLGLSSNPASPQNIYGHLRNSVASTDNPGQRGPTVHLRPAELGNP